MSKYNKDTKFFWLQLKEDFFDDDAIQWLEEQKPNGRDYAYFYLKLCLKSLRTNGILIRNVGEILIPYDNEKLAELTKMDFDTVVVAMDLLKNIGLVKILENGEIYMNQIEKMIGAKSIGAFKKQQQRLLRGQEADICPPEIEIEKEIDIKINKNNEQKQILLDYFETIWKEYPNKKGKAKALEYYLQWIKGRKVSEVSKKLTKEQMYQAVKKYKKECEKNRTEQQYIKHGDTFFNKAILDYIENDEEKVNENSYKEIRMTNEEYQRKINEGGKRYV